MQALSARIAEVAVSTGPRADRARRAAELFLEAGDYRWVGIYDVLATRISAIGWTGSKAPAFPVFPRMRGLNGAAVASGRPVVVQDVREDPRYLETFGDTRAEAIFPVLDAPRARVVGTVDVESERVGAFTPEDVAQLDAGAQALRPLWEGVTEEKP